MLGDGRHYDGNNIGKIVISLDNEKIGEVNIYKTDKKKEDNNFFQKFKHLFRWYSKKINWWTTK